MSSSLAYVTGTADLTARLRRISFDVPDLAELGLPGIPDEAVGIYFPEPGHDSSPAVGVGDGRNYSIRAVDHSTGTISVDFVVHSHGPATTWAQRTAPGDSVALSHARGWYRPPSSAQWLLLITDLAGLPAAARILEELPAEHLPVTVLAEVVDDDDLAYLGVADLAARGQVVTLVGSGNGYAPSGLGDAVADLELPDGQGYCWFAAEAAQSRAVRKYIRRELGWAPEYYDIIGYWRFDGEAWSRRYAEHGDELFAIYQQAIADGKSEKQAAEEFDEALERAGL